MVAFGSAGDGVTQLSDGHGSLFKGGRLAPRSSWPKGVAPLPDFTDTHSPLQLVSFDKNLKHPITATVKRGRGGGEMSMNLPGLQANLEAGGKPGQVDQVGVDPRGDSISYQAGAGGTGFGGTLLAAPGATPGARSSKAASGLSDHLVGFETGSGKGAGDQVSFGAGRAFVFSRENGAPTTLKLTLSAFDTKGRPVAVRLPAVRVGSGATVKVAPPTGGPSHRPRSGSGPRSVAGPRPERPRETDRKAVRHRHPCHAGQARGRAGRRRAEAASAESSEARVDRPRGNDPARRPRHRAPLPLQISASAIRSGKALLQLPKALKKGRYTLRVRALETTAESGGVQGSETAERTLGLHLG